MATVTVTSPGGDWADVVSCAFLDVVSRSAGLRFCLATGATPAPAYRQSASSGLDLSSITVALLDEFGGLDADDPGRCLAMLERDLLGRLTAERRPLLELIDVNEIPDPGGPGPIRLAVLGIGENGHIGMNEPGSAPDIGTRHVELAASTSIGALRYGARHAPTWGVTIGLGPLLASEELWVLATGESKASVVAAAIDGPITASIPASLLQGRSAVRWFLDADAAGMLDG